MCIFPLVCDLWDGVLHMTSLFFLLYGIWTSFSCVWVKACRLVLLCMRASAAAIRGKEAGKPDASLSEWASRLWPGARKWYGCRWNDKRYRGAVINRHGIARVHTRVYPSTQCCFRHWLPAVFQCQQTNQIFFSLAFSIRYWVLKGFCQLFHPLSIKIVFFLLAEVTRIKSFFFLTLAEELANITNLCFVKEQRKREKHGPLE